MLNFRVYGINAKIVTLVTASIGKALFLNDMDVKDYTATKESHTEGVVRSEKGTVNSIDPLDSDAFIFIGHHVQIRDLNDGATVVFYSKEKTGSNQLKKHKTKNYIIVYENVLPEQQAASAVLGGIAKVFDKISAKNMRLAIESEIGKDKVLFDSFEEGYKSIKMLR